MTPGRAAALYALALLPSSLAALALAGSIMDLSGNSIPRRPSGVDGWLLNLLPALTVGLAAYLALARLLRPAPGARHTLAEHARRCAALYVVAIGLGAGLAHDGGSADFWGMGQIVLWLWLVAIGGIVADGITTRRRRRTGIVA